MKIEGNEWNAGRAGVAEAIAAHAFGVPLPELRSAGCDGSQAWKAKSVAIHLAHRILRVPLSRISQPHPAAARSACRSVAQRRRNPAFDRTMASLEMLARNAAGGVA